MSRENRKADDYSKYLNGHHKKLSFYDDRQRDDVAEATATRNMGKQVCATIEELPAGSNIVKLSKLFLQKRNK